MQRLTRVLCLLTFCALTAFTVHAETFTYTFEAPQFTAGQVTPLLNRSPNIGSASFQASFVSDVAGLHQILNFEPNPLFSGQSLLSPTIPNVLTISFNMPVNQVQFVWAQESPGAMAFAGAAGDQAQDSANLGGLFEGGTFVFSSATSFTSFRIAAFSADLNFTNFAIDNLTLTTPSEVPEPTTLLLLGTGLAALTKLRKRSRQ
ncbi:MAG: PEP-CTERM sorting domain-containing protein [Pyrinomonadaceae bacterium]|nr:PEP-CTERM sorting domain-containing protein [Pyrinomonadaceae bacterium]